MKPSILFIAISIILSSCLNKESHRGDFDMSIAIQPEQNFSQERAAEILKQRLLKYGLDENQFHIIVQNTIIISLTGVDDTQRLKNLMTPSGELEIRETYSNIDYYHYLDLINAALGREKAMIESKTATNPLTSEPVSSTVSDSSGAGMNKLSNDDQNILYSKLSPAIYEDASGKYHLAPGPILGYCMRDDTSEVMKMLYSDVAQPYLPLHMKFCWSLSPNQSYEMMYSLYAINYDSTGTPFLSGYSVKHARMDMDANGKPEINIEFTDDAAKIFNRMTKRNIEKFLAIMIDGKVATAPKVIAEVDGKRASITGSDENEMKDICNVLQSDPFPHRTILKVH